MVVITLIKDTPLFVFEQHQYETGIRVKRAMLLQVTDATKKGVLPDKLYEDLFEIVKNFNPQGFFKCLL